MTTKHSPATSLPWRTGPATTPQGNQLGIRGIWTQDKKTGVAEAFGDRANADYIVNAANAYPKLVQTVREFRNMAYVEEKDVLVARIDALLHELGETE